MALSNVSPNLSVSQVVARVNDLVQVVNQIPTLLAGNNITLAINSSSITIFTSNNLIIPGSINANSINVSTINVNILTVNTINASVNIYCEGMWANGFVFTSNGAIGVAPQTNFIGIGGNGSLANAEGSALIWRRSYDNINLMTLDGNGDLTILGTANLGKFTASATSITANNLTGLTGTALCNGVANTLHFTNGILTSIT